MFLAPGAFWPSIRNATAAKFTSKSKLVRLPWENLAYRHFLLWMFVSGFLTCWAEDQVTHVLKTAHPANAPAKPAFSTIPNIVLIIPDDQAFGDFGFMGHQQIQTPHLDRLAESAVVFPNGYVPSSLCRPSLVTMLTGLYPHQHFVHFNDGPDKQDRQQSNQLIAELPTMPRLLAKQGFVSLQTGKFWEGHFATAGFTQGMTHGDPKQRLQHPGLGVLTGRHGDLGLTIGRHTMQPIADFLDQHPKQPFFLWYAPFLPHEPFNPPKRLLQRYESLDIPPRLRQYYAMCTWLDETVGQLLEMLQAKQRLEQTLIILACDNGWITATDRPRGFAAKSKRSPYESGIRTPILFHWPSQLQPQRHDELVHTIDLLPTILAAVGQKQPANLPGVNLLPLLTGQEATLPREAIFGEIFEHDAKSLREPAKHLLSRWVRFGPYKFIDFTATNQADELYDLSQDPNETINLLDQPDQKEVAERARKLLSQWWQPANKDL